MPHACTGRPSGLSSCNRRLKTEIAVQQYQAGVIQFLPTVERIVYGAGVIDTLGSEIDRLGAHRVMMLTARSLEDGPLMRRIIPHLGVRHAGTLAMEFEHVPLESVAAAVAAARRWSADVIVALGGGSVIDAAKAVRICIAAGLISADDLGAFIEHPGPLINGLIPQLSIPTTLSGSEYTRSFSATNFTQGIKRSYTNSAAASRVIMYDPLAAMDTPMRLWLASGVMAIDHAVEVFCASPPHLVGDTLKLAAARELISNLPLTRQTPADANGRLRCQIAAWMADHSPLRTQPLAPAAAALPSHALAYELSALCRVSYGIVACVILPASLRWTVARNSAQAARQAAMGRALGLAAPDGPDAQAAGALADRLARLIAALDLPARLGDSGVRRNDFAKIARAFAARGGSLTGNEPATEADVMDLLESAW